MKDFTKWRSLFTGVILAFLMLVSGQTIGQFVEIGTPSGTSNTTSTYPTPFGNWYWGARQQFLYPASELAAAGLAAGDITAMRFNVTSTNGTTHNGYTVQIGQTSSSSLTAWEAGLTTVYGPLNQTPVVGYNTFNFSSPFNWDGVSNVVVEICFQNSSFTQNSVVEWTEVLGYNGSRTFRADATGVCANTNVTASQNPTRRPMTEFEGTFASCPPPFDLLVTNVGENSADLSWTDSGGDVYVEYGPAPFTPGSDANAGGGTVAGPFTGGTYTIPGLNPQTDYVVYVREECTPGTWSLNTSASFTTSCAVFPTPFFEDFEGLTTTQTETFPNCWDNLGTNFWRVRNSQGGSAPSPGYDVGAALGATDHTTGSGSYIWMDGSTPAPPLDDGTPANNEVITPPIDISGLSDPYLSLWVGKYYTGTFGQTELKVYAWDGAAWLELIAYAAQDNSSWTELSTVLPGTLPGVTQIRIVAWTVATSAFYDDILVDDIYVGEAPACLAANNLAAEVVDANTVDLTWDCLGCTGDFYVEYGAPGFAPGTGATAGGGTVVGPITGNTTQVGGLSADTDYSFVVRQDCGVDGFSFNSSFATAFTGYCQGGPTSAFDSNLGVVSASGLGGSSFSFDHCAPPSGPDAGYIGVLDQTALSVDVAEGFGGSVVVEIAACDGSTFTNQHELWIDWNGNLTYEPGESIGSGSGNPITEEYDILPPPGTPVGTYRMRVMLQETGAVPPLNPCASYTWGSMTEFSINVVPPPDCTQPVADFNLLADCGVDQYSIEVDLTSAGDSPGGLVDITNNGGVPDQLGVGVGTYVFGPFAAGANVTFTVEHLGDPICNISSGSLGTDCVLCGGGPTSTFDSNVELVEINGFAGSGFSHVGCPGVAGVQDLTALSADVPNGFTYNVDVDFGTCGGNFAGAGSVWVDWNGDFQFSASELIGSTASAPTLETFTVSPPAGTPIGPKVMRVMQVEGGALPLDPCDSFTWGSVMDFTINVIADPGCLPPSVDLAVAAGSCTTDDYTIDVIVNNTGDSPGDLVTISTDYDAVTVDNVGPGTYQVGPFPSGTEVAVTVQHLGDPLCNFSQSFVYNCPPPNNDCVDAIPLTVEADGNCMLNAVSATTTAATQDGADAPCLITGLTDVFFSFSTGANPNVFWTVELGTMEAIGVEVLDACNGTSLFCQGDVFTGLLNLEANSDYIFRVLTIPGFDGTFDICLNEGPEDPLTSCAPEFSVSPGAFITNTSPTVSTITVGPQAGGSIITDLDVAVDINHTWVSDLTLTLTSPCGTEIILQDSECGTADDFTALYDDESNNVFADWCVAPLNRYGDVAPQDLLSAFDIEQIEGDWTLTVTDGAGGDDGTLVQWCLVPTLENICPAPEIEVTAFTDQTITIDLVGGGCFDSGNYDSFDVTWTGSGGGTALGVSLPYQLTGLNPGEAHIIDISGNCTGATLNPTFGVSQATLNCAPEDLCTYELTLSNATGTGFGDGIVQVSNGWTTTDYIMDSELSTQTWTILACPGNSISLFLTSETGTEPSNDFEISLVNSDNVEVFNEAGPDASTFYFAEDGCPDCSPVNDVQFSRLAADLIEVSWNNVALVGNVNDILIEVLDGGFAVIASETVPAGTTSASVALGASYPFEFVTVQITTLCTNEGTGQTEVFTSLPGCDAAEQCEYVFDLSSAGDGWDGNALDVLIDGTTNISVSLETGTTGSQSIFACADGTIDVTADVGGGGTPGSPCFSSTPFGTINVSDNGVPVSTSGVWAGERPTVNVTGDGTYEFTSSISSDYLTVTDGSDNVIAAGVQPVYAALPSGTGYRLHVFTNASCGTQSTSRTLTALFVGTGAVSCDEFDFELTLNPTTDNVSLVSLTDLCPYDNGDVVYSATTCPSCFAPIDAEVVDVSATSVDVSWFSNNAAGTAYTIYVGLPGFTPGVDEVASFAGVTAAAGAQGPETVSGLSAFTDYEAVVIEDCGSDLSDPSNLVAFTTLIDNDDCSDVTPVSYSAPDVLVFTGGSVGANDNSLGGSYGVGQAWEAITITGCAQNVVIEFCGSTPAMSTAFTGISTGCPAEFPTNYLVADDWNWDDCGDGNPTLYYDQLLAGDYYIPIIEGHAYTLTITSEACSGCTDPNAINFDPNAVVDDGSCVVPLCDFPTLTTTIVDDCVDGTFTVLLDIGTDGDATDYDVVLGGAPGSPCFSTTAFGTINVSDNGVPVSTSGVWAGERPTVNVTGDGTYEFSSSVATDYLTLTDGANNVIAAGVQPISGVLPTGTGYRVHVFTGVGCGTQNSSRTITGQYVGPPTPAVVGTFPGGTTGISVGPFAIGSDASITVEHNDDSTCDQTITVTSNTICGCTDPNAINYSPLAEEDDGSCIIPDCTDPATTFTYCYGNNENSSFFVSPTTPGDNIILSFIQGTIESSTWDDFIVYDGADATAPILFSNPSTTSQLDGVILQSTLGNGLFITISTDGSGSCQSTTSYNEIIADIFCGSIEIPGCTDPNSPNYNPDATIDDGSCITCDAGFTAVVFEMFDSFGDGWNGATYTLTSFVDPLNPTVIATGDLNGAEFGDGSSEGFDVFCLEDGCYEIVLTGGSFASEIDWTLLGADGGDISGGAPATIDFTINTPVCPVPGCTDPNAVNFDPAANFDDGSCVLPPANDDCVDAQVLTPVEYPATNNTLGTLSGASENGTTACAGTNGADVFYTFNVPMENHYWVNLNPFSGFAGVVEVLDACDGTVVACEFAPPSAPFCDVAQGGPGFSSDPGCEAAICGSDAWCCSNSWDGVCASAATSEPACSGCLSTAPAGSGPVSAFIQNLPAGDYIVRVRDYYGTSYLTPASFLVNVQSFPTAKVQDDPNNVLFACNQSGFQLEDFVGAIPQAGQLFVNGDYPILDYEWFIAEQGGTFQNTWQREEPNYSTRLDWLGMTYGTTYNVYVRILLDVPGEGPIWGVYQIDGPDPHVDGAQECTITTSGNVSLTEVLPAYTPTNISGNDYALCDFVIAYNVLSADNFRWRFDPDTDPNNGNEIIYTRGIGNPSVRLSWVNNLQPGATYQVAVEARVDGQWSGYGNVNPITLAGVPNNLQLSAGSCNGTYAPNGVIVAQNVCYYDFYQFRLTPQAGGDVRQKVSFSHVLLMGTIQPALDPGVYDVQVRIRQNGVLGDFGPSCPITISGPTMPGDEPVAQRAETTGNASLFPNPNAGSEVRMELDGLADGNHEVMIQIYDVYGKLIHTDGFGHQGERMSRLVRFDNELAMGVYMVHVVVDGERFATERLVVK